MGHRKLAATIKGTDHSSSKSCYSSESITAHLRGWDNGFEIELKLDENELPYLEIRRTLGSHNPKARNLIATITVGKVYVVEQ
jgi:hypothetical protein